MSKVFICAAIPDEQAIKEEGAVAVATAIEAGDERRARAKFTWQFLEQYPAAQDCAYKFLVCEDKPGMPRPAIDSWDTEYMQENRWDEESASFIPVEPESDPINVNFDKLSLEVQNAVLVKFGTCENITVDMAIDAQELLQEDVATFDGHIVEALMKTPEINAMYPERKLFAIGWVKHKCKPGTKWPEIQAELRNWKKRQDAERKETGKYTSVVDLARAKANRQHTENPAEKIPPVTAAIHREYKQTWKTLDRELAYYLWPGDADAGNIDGSILRWAKNEVIARDREDWKRISASMRKQPDALRYSRQTIFGLVRERPIDIHKDPVALNKYITEYLTTKGVFEDEGRNQSATDTLSSPVPETDAVETAIPDNEKTECKVEVEPSVEREGPFYFLFTDKDGEKYGRANKLSGLDKALAAGAAEITKEEYLARKNGTYTDLPQNVDTAEDSVQPEPVKVTADEVNKIMQAANISQPDADKLLAASRGEFVEGISDPNDPKWVKGIETCDSVNQNQSETEQNDQKAEQNSPNALQDEPETKQSEPVAQQEEEKVCTACGQSGGGNCPDCGAVMGDATYQETFDEESQVEAKENDPEEMEGAEHPHNENAGSDPHRDCSDETGEVADPVIVEDIEPGIYYGISNENYHAGPGVSKSQLDDIADTPALYLWRKNAPVDTTKTKTLDLGTAFHCRVLEPEEFSNRFIVAPEFNRRTNSGKEEEKAFLRECASTGKTVITAEEGRKIELMYQSVMALPLGQWLVESAGHAESSIYWEDPETAILCRCRPDKIIPEFHWIMDVKTTADIQRFKTAYYDYRYHVQDAFYSDGYEAQFGVQPTFVFLVASTTIECGRYPVEIFMMGEEAKLAGQLEYHRNLRTLADCLNTDEWPAIKTLSLPRWAKEYAND
ncbi:exonuclease [Escherichia coli]|uniref:PD-(D/E)XK nuclease-like domain-containing protein n=3 Tax=Escherichia coli TaxID=562 RepID=UPI0007E8F920|nr:PD-(D/E)XK nuclease-like domain-containing protein [Escherichia coli]EED0607045.1 exonuclease [Escherichia coli]EER0208134.1 exonuclease [Escherichia coli]EER1858909.1 exonuclease [Escherichia coli]EES3808848.1 exonuclease [Escherichia coli]EEV4012781.1 exonuclease [Escherichia coli]